MKKSVVFLIILSIIGALIFWVYWLYAKHERSIQTANTLIQLTVEETSYNVSSEYPVHVTVNYVVDESLLPESKVITINWKFGNAVFISKAQINIWDRVDGEENFHFVFSSDKPTGQFTLQFSNADIAQAFSDKLSEGSIAFDIYERLKQKIN